jgi:hypothetical protein
MRILMSFVTGEAVNIGGKDYVVSDVRRDSNDNIQVTFTRKQFITKRPEDIR